MHTDGFMKELPRSVTSRAFRASNGEYAWRRRDLPEALRAIASTCWAILGGEVWVVRNDEIWAAIPEVGGGPSGVWGWEIQPRRPDERRSDYCNRTVQESLESVDQMPVEASARLDVRDRLYFNVTYVREDDA